MEMNYDEWMQAQVKTHGVVRKPIKYKIGQWLAMEKLLRNKYTHNQNILDFGCAEGTGILYMHYIGFDNVIGYDVNQEKIDVANDLGVSAFCRDITGSGIVISLLEKFDVIWSSHSFEHVWNPESSLVALHSYLKPKGHLILILPYVDTGTEEAHTASREIGLRKKDNGKTVTQWFTDRGFKLVERSFSTFREPEIWLVLEKE